MRPVVSARLNTSVWSTSWPISSYLGINLSRSFQVHRTNKIGNVRTILPWGVFMQPLLQWKNDKYCIFWAYVCSIRYPALSPLACPHLQYFSTLSYTRGTFFEKKKALYMKCVFWYYLQLLSETFLIRRKTERDMIRNVPEEWVKILTSILGQFQNFC